MKFKESIYKYVEQFPLLEEEDGKPSIRQTCAKSQIAIPRNLQISSPQTFRANSFRPEEEDGRYTVIKASLN